MRLLTDFTIGRPAICLLLCGVALAPHSVAGPLDYGLGEVNAAFAERKLKWRVKTDLNMDPPESFRIEPYAYGGAHITGGDVRGLMYGLLEASEQVRANGRILRTQGVAATPLRGVRIEIGPELESASEEFWRDYFQRLARNRFNRAHVTVPRIQPPFRLEQRLSQIAADYSVDLTLGFESSVTQAEVLALLKTCPLLHSLAIKPESPSTQAVTEAAKLIGRRVTVDLDGTSHLKESEVAVVRPQTSWPPSFEMEAPFDILRSSEHEVFYWVWGRFGYDPATRLPKSADPVQYGAMREAALWLAAMSQARANGSEYVASLDHVRGDSDREPFTAKLRPSDLANRLEDAAARIRAASNGTAADGRLIADAASRAAAALRMDRDESGRAGSSSDTSGTARPKFVHVPVASAPGEQALTLKLQILAAPAVLKSIAIVRLHYRPLDPYSEETVLEAPAGTDVSFTIPATGITGRWDLQYYFEILSRQKSGWFEPDPAAGLPLPIVKIVPSRTGPN